MKPSKIGYRDDIVKPYVEATEACKTVAALVTELKTNWKELCPDALKQAKTLSDADWLWCLKHKGHKKHAKKINELAGAVLLPETILRVVILANRFGVPDGCAYIRMTEIEAEEKP